MKDKLQCATAYSERRGMLFQISVFIRWLFDAVLYEHDTQTY